MCSGRPGLVRCAHEDLKHGDTQIESLLKIKKCFITEMLFFSSVVEVIADT